MERWTDKSFAIKRQKKYKELCISRKVYHWGILILLALLILCGNIIGTRHTNAKYAGRISGNADVARVAAVGGNVSVTNSVTEIAPGTADWLDCYVFEVANYEKGSTKASEVTLDYMVTVEVDGPGGLAYRVVPTAAAGETLCSKLEIQTVVDNVLRDTTGGGVFSANGNKQTHSYKIQAKWVDTSAVNAGQPIKIKVTVDATQRD